ncbi:MAG: pantetheine-phosphate adenylyltransferase [Lachnospiraceae bacterium]|nr:pantetheine-phosphate adenylyltransferase [Lachnospiraceae bacterium]
MKTCIYPGSFDPITYGHIDIIERASKITDKLIVAVLNNYDKHSLFTVEERLEMIKDSVKDFNNVEVESFEGLLVDYVKSKDAQLIIRGLRAVTDFEYELQMAQTNRELYKDIDTIFLLTNLKYSYVSSSAVKQVASFDGDVSKFVTPFVADKLKRKYNKHIV